jgi:hypothetical protein
LAARCGYDFDADFRLLIYSLEPLGGLLLDEGLQRVLRLSNALICAIPNKAQQGQAIIFAPAILNFSAHGRPVHSFPGTGTL